MRKNIAERLKAKPHIHDQQCLRCEAADEIERLSDLVQELRPYLEAHIRNGMECSPGFIHTDVDDCADCRWYKESIAWKKRIDGGELS